MAPTVILLLAFAATACAQSADELLQAHLAQAQAVAPSAEQPGTDASIEQLKSDIRARAAAWTLRISSPNDLGAGELLAGIPDDLQQQARDATSDDAKAAVLLEKNVDLPVLLALAAARNPDARAAYQNLRARLRAFEQASYLEDLVTQYRAFVREIDTRVGPQTHKEMLGDTFPFPAALALKGQLVDAQAEQARLDYLIALRKALNDTARMFFDAQHAGHVLPLLREERGVLELARDSARRQLEVAGSGRADALKAQSALDALDSRVAEALSMQRSAAAQLNALLGLPANTSFGTFADTDLAAPPQSLDAVLERVRAASPELHKAEADLHAMETMVRMAETEVYPRGSAGQSTINPSAGAEAGPTRNMDTTFPEKPMVDARDAGFGANAAYIDELRVRVQSSRAMLDAARAQANSRAQDSFARATAAARMAENQRVIAAQTRSAADAMRERYAAGAATQLEYLDAAREALDSDLMYHAARHERHKAGVDLLDAQGLTAASAPHEGAAHD